MPKKATLILTALASLTMAGTILADQVEDQGYGNKVIIMTRHGITIKCFIAAQAQNNYYYYLLNPNNFDIQLTYRWGEGGSRTISMPSAANFATGRNRNANCTYTLGTTISPNRKFEIIQLKQTTVDLMAQDAERFRQRIAQQRVRQGNNSTGPGPNQIAETRQGITIYFSSTTIGSLNPNNPIRYLWDFTNPNDFDVTVQLQWGGPQSVFVAAHTDHGIATTSDSGEGVPYITHIIFE